MEESAHEIWLWNEIRYGNERALYQLYMLYYDHFFRFGLHLSGNRERVMESINEVFTEIWRKHDLLPEVEKVKSYLFVVYKRKLSRKLVPEKVLYLAEEEENTPVTLKEFSYEEILIASQMEEEVKIKIQNALSKLSPRQKQLIRFRYFDGLSLEDISEKLDISLRTVYNTIHSAIKILRKELHRPR